MLLVSNGTFNSSMANETRSGSRDEEHQNSMPNLMEYTLGSEDTTAAQHAFELGAMADDR